MPLSQNLNKTNDDKFIYACFISDIKLELAEILSEINQHSNIINLDKFSNNNIEDLSNKITLKYSELVILYSKDLKPANIGNIDNINNNFIKNYCLIIELLDLACDIHNLINDSTKTNKTYQIYSINFSVEQLILIGDLLFTIAFKKLVQLEHNNTEIIQQILECFSKATKNMALYESKLAELEITTINIDSTDILDKILDILFSKNWQFINCILLLYKLKILEPNPGINNIEEELKTANKIIILNKITKNKITFKSSIHNFIYQKDNQDRIKGLKVSVTREN